MTGAGISGRPIVAVTVRRRRRADRAGVGSDAVRGDLLSQRDKHLRTLEDPQNRLAPVDPASVLVRGDVVDRERQWLERLIDSTERAATQLKSRDTENSRRLVEELEALHTRLLTKLREESQSGRAD